MTINNISIAIKNLAIYLSTTKGEKNDKIEIGEQTLRSRE